MSEEEEEEEGEEGQAMEQLVCLPEKPHVDRKSATEWRYPVDRVRRLAVRSSELYAASVDERGGRPVVPIHSCSTEKTLQEHPD